MSAVGVGSEAEAGCTAHLDRGTPVLAEGTLTDRVPATRTSEADRAPRASLRLVDATLIQNGRWCRVGALRVLLSRGETGADAGAIVSLLGSWRSSPATLLPRNRIRQGYVSVRSWRLEGEGGGGPLVRIRGALGARLDDRIRTETLAGVAKALVLADRSVLDRAVRQRFIDAGIVHLLAISGLHVGMVAGALVWVLGLRDRGRGRWVQATVAVWFYIALIGAPPAATRAALVFAGHAYCRWRGTPGRVSDLAGIAAIVALSFQPLLIVDPGFQLSFAGFAGVIAGHRASRRLPSIRFGSSLGLVIASAGAFLFTAPIAAVHFGRVVATSIPASVASTGLVALALPAVAGAALLPGALGSFAGEGASMLLRVLVALANVFADVPFRWRADPTMGWTLVACALLAIMAGVSGRRRRPLWTLAMALVTTATLARPAVKMVLSAGTPLLCTLSVGQGDAALARTSGGRWLLFDAGPGTSILEGREMSEGDRRLASWMRDAGHDVIVPFLRSFGARRIELFVLSHPHLDHFGGVGAVFDRLSVRHVLDPGVPEPSAAYLGLLERVEEEGALWVRATAGDEIVIDDARLTVLWPAADERREANETSLSFRLDLAGFTYVNTGDAPVETEAAILRAADRGVLKADLIKLGHHGSKTSSSVSWLDAIDPAMAVMSLGRDNRYGHPHDATLLRLDSAGVRRVWRTDRDGTLCIAIGEDGWSIVDG